MKKAELYSHISEKKSLVQEASSLSPLESLIHCLDVLDLNAALSKHSPSKRKNPDDGIEWIELSFIDK